MRLFTAGTDGFDLFNLLMILLGPFARANLILVHAEDIVRFGGVFSRDIMKCRRGDIVGLALADQAVIIQ